VLSVLGGVLYGEEGRWVGGWWWAMLEFVVLCSARRRQAARVSRCSRATVGQFWRDSRT